MKYIVKLIMVIVWIAGVIIANGFWSTLFAFILPFWGWYLVIEKLLKINGWLGL